MWSTNISATEEVQLVLSLEVLIDDSANTAGGNTDDCLAPSC
jgi:hypothetical protein